MRFRRHNNRSYDHRCGLGSRLSEIFVNVGLSSTDFSTHQVRTSAFNFVAIEASSVDSEVDNCVFRQRRDIKSASSSIETLLSAQS